MTMPESSAGLGLASYGERKCWLTGPPVPVFPYASLPGNGCVSTCRTEAKRKAKSRSPAFDLGVRSVKDGIKGLWDWSLPANAEP